MIDNQFYPTPVTLAFKAFNLFQNKNIVRLLEPSAGRGDLLQPVLNSVYKHSKNIDCIEIDLENQSILRGKDLNVIDGDFLQSDIVGMYSHILMNPPFNKGVDHVLKAWNILYNGEVVAILNAESIKNPKTAKQGMLFNLIQDFGSVEYIQQAFTTPDTQRTTNVEIALIYLKKTVDFKQSFTHDLERDSVEQVEVEEKHQLAIRSNTITNVVRVFNSAVESMKAAEIAEEEAIYYANLLGDALNQEKANIEPSANSLQSRYNARYLELKKKAWSNVLKSTDFSKYLSSKAYQKLVTDFDEVVKLSFTENNIRGFLLGLVEGQSEMNMQMLLDCFDEITKYKSDNRAYYQGWKSNDKHKENAFRVKMTRFIIPTHGSSWSDSMPWELKHKLADFDKVFAMLDGKQKPENPLADMVEKRWDSLRDGNREASSYFEIRYYHGKKTMHFFPIRKDLIDRLNRMVGKERAWLPQDDTTCTKEFWKQYTDAEKITSKMQIKSDWQWRDKEEENLRNAHNEACEKLGYDTTKFNLLT
ncbi:MAG: DUF4942 domain-containing protein [Bacteroidales bacterium]|jgi:hypothetical protein